MEETKDLSKFVSETMAKIEEGVGKRRPHDRWIYSGRVKYFERVATARERGQPIVWTNFCNAPEIFYSMGMVPLQTESFWAVVTGLSPEIPQRHVDIAEQYLPDYICAANKCMIGMALAGDIPLPDIIVHPSHPCDSGLISYPTIADYLGIPHFCIDIPYWSDERTYEYITDEMEAMIAFVEEKTGRKLEFDRLKEVVQLSNQAQEYLLKINDLRKNVPCPISGTILGLNTGAILNQAGTQELVDYARTQYEISKERVEKGEGHLPEEKKRLAFLYTMPFYDPRLFEWMEKEFGAIVVMDMMANYINKPIEDLSTRRKILRGLAEKLTLMPMARECRGPAEYWIDIALKTCRDYKADAAIFTLGIACKNGWGIIKLIKDRIQDELEIPAYVGEIDVMDSRVSSPETIRSGIEDFLSTVM